MYANQPPVTANPDILAAAAVYFPGEEHVSALPGFPNQVVVGTASGEWAVRQWPVGATLAAVEWTANALVAAREAGMRTAPDHAAVPGRGSQRGLLHNGRVYDAVSWPTGRPLNRYGTFQLVTGDAIDLPLPDSMAAPDVLTEAVGQLATLHRATAALAAHADAPVLTLETMQLDARNRYAALRKRVGRHAGDNPEIRRWLRCANRIIPAASERLAEMGDLLHARQCVIHGTPWPSHLMMDDRDGGMELTGITGWTKARASVPLIDLARIAARCQRWSQATTETVVGAYVDRAPLPPEQRRLVPVIAGLDLTSVTGVMLQAAFDDDRLIDDPIQALLRSGIHTSLRSLETLANVLVPDERPARNRSFHARPRRQDRRPSS